LLLLFTVAVLTALANYFGQAHATLASNFLNLLITVPLLASLITLLVRDRAAGDLGKSWICFTAFISLWFIAERIWTVYEVIYQIDPWPSEADYFWLAGYPAYFAFTFFYLRPFRESITRSVLLFAFGITVALAGLLTYWTVQQYGALDFETGLGLAYPVLDTVAIAPIIVCLILFARGQVSFLWSCLFIGMLCFVVADHGFVFLSLEDEYYTGHVADIPYLWGYLLFLFGSVNYTRMFKKRNAESRFNDQEDMR